MNQESNFSNIFVNGNVTYTDKFENSIHQKYWMYLVIHELYENLASVESFITLIANFGKSLENKAEVVLPLKSAYKETRRSILRKAWDFKTTEKLAKTQDIYMLVLSQPLSSFDPRNEERVFLDLGSQKQSLILFNMQKFLNLIGEEIRQDNNIFVSYFRHLASQQRSNMSERIISSVQARPGVFGFSVDLKQLLFGSK